MKRARPVYIYMTKIQNPVSCCFHPYTSSYFVFFHSSHNIGFCWPSHHSCQHIETRSATRTKRAPNTWKIITTIEDGLREVWREIDQGYCSRQGKIAKATKWQRRHWSRAQPTIARVSIASFGDGSASWMRKEFSAAMYYPDSHYGVVHGLDVSYLHYSYSVRSIHVARKCDRFGSGGWNSHNSHSYQYGQSTRQMEKYRNRSLWLWQNKQQSLPPLIDTHSLI